ncbi:hypothetical protein Q1695_016450 [Nippostrongylus brasiliensis]|nr:hypothetical protein Q1695_016450 [Nippostrongylus brasiliensis]
MDDRERSCLSPRTLLSATNIVRQQSDTTGVRRLIRGVAVEDDRPQTSHVGKPLLGIPISFAFALRFYRLCSCSCKASFTSAVK